MSTTIVKLTYAFVFVFLASIEQEPIVAVAGTFTVAFAQYRPVRLDTPSLASTVLNPMLFSSTTAISVLVEVHATSAVVASVSNPVAA